MKLKTTLLLVFIGLSMTITAQDTKDVFEVIHSRKSVRAYTDQPVDIEILKEVVKAGMAAPTGRNIQPWEFIILNEEKAISNLAEALPGNRMLKTCKAVIIVAGDAEKSVFWALDCSAATQNILLALEAKGLGGVWTAGYPIEERMATISEALKLPENIKVLCVIPVGYPTGKEQPKDKYKPEKIHINKW